MILLDLMMPEMSGFTVVEELQCDKATATIPIIIVTAKDVTAQDRSALCSGSDMVVEIVEKAAFTRASFVDGVQTGHPSHVSEDVNGPRPHH